MLCGGDKFLTRYILTGDKYYPYIVYIRLPPHLNLLPMLQTKTSQRFGRQGHWLPSHDDHLKSWILKKQEQVKNQDKTLHPVMQEFRDLIYGNPLLRMEASKMIAQVPHHYRHKHDPDYANAYLTSIDQMIELINGLLDHAPEFHETELVGCPINAVLDWVMFTPAGCAFFADPQVNKSFKKILNTWSSYLDTKDSLSVLNSSPSGWMCKKAMEKIKIDEYEYDPEDPHWGFKSWNDFFTRRIQKSERPIAEPHNNKVITASCDSQVYAIQHDVQFRSNFWIKEQPYSLTDIFSGDPIAEAFVGGTIVQAFLSAFNYHRWNSPISGTIKKAWVTGTTYYSEAESEGADPGGPDRSQGYISHVAVRAIIIIEKKEDKPGLIAMVYIGMAEISSCKITVKEGDKVQKGDEIGHFQYGGSTHCMLLQPGVLKELLVKKNDIMKMGEQIAESL